MLIEGRKRRGWQRMRWLDGITNSMDIGLGGLREWWWTGRPGVLWFMGSQWVGHDWATELNWWPFYVFFGKKTCLFTSLVHCLKLGCLVFWYWVIWTLYVLDINPLLDIAFANIFSHSIGNLFASFLWIENQLVSFLKCIGAVNEIEVVSVMSLWVIKLYCFTRTDSIPHL